MKTMEIATVHCVENGWLVTVRSRNYGEDTYVCTTWEEVEKRVKEAAFFFPKFTEARKP